MTDPISDFLTRLRNASKARRDECSAPYSKVKEGLAAILKAEGYLSDYATGSAPEAVAAAYRTRRPGVASPMWNVYATMLRRALRPYGAQARLARYLGIPPQRLSDFLTGRRRLPDAELTLRLLHWLAELRTGRDVSL